MASGGPSIFASCFEKGLRNAFLEIVKNASKNHISMKIAPNLLKQILLDFLELDLSIKNIACQFCDTFI
jgi:hypothetical protein